MHSETAHVEVYGPIRELCDGGYTWCPEGLITNVLHCDLVPRKGGRVWQSGSMCGGTDSGAYSDCVQVHRFENIYFNSVKWIIRFLTCSKPSSKIACQNLSEEFWFKGQITHYKSDQASWTLMYICQYPAAAPEPAAATHPTRRNCFMSPFTAVGFQVCGRSDLQHSGLRRRATKLKSGAA